MLKRMSFIIHYNRLLITIVITSIMMFISIYKKNNILYIVFASRRLIYTFNYREVNLVKRKLLNQEDEILKFKKRLRSLGKLGGII